MRGPSWDLRVRLALNLAMLGTVIIFGSALPLLYVAGLLYFTIAYFADKAALLRVCRLPPLFGSAGISHIPIMMGIALLARLGVAAWAFSFLHAGSVLFPSNAPTLLARLSDSAVIVHSATLAVLLAVLAATAVVRGVWAICRAVGAPPASALLCGGSSSRGSSSLQQPAFADLLKRQALVGPDSYSLRNAVWYAPWHVEVLLTTVLQLGAMQPDIAPFIRRLEVRHDAAVAARKAAAELAAQPKDGNGSKAQTAGVASAAGTRYLMQPGCESAKMPPAAAEEDDLGFGLTAVMDTFLGAPTSAELMI